jgi:hypothetical protein
MLISLAFFGGVCYVHLLSFLWRCLLCSSLHLSLVVFDMTTKENLKEEHNKHHQRKLKR